MSIRSLRVWSKIEHRIHRWDQRQIDHQRSGPFWVRTPESVGGACQGNFEPPVWPNIHSLYETNGAETFRAKEMPLCQEVWTQARLLDLSPMRVGIEAGLC